jgi:hypothetical protein
MLLTQEGCSGGLKLCPEDGNFIRALHIVCKPTSSSFLLRDESSHAFSFRGEKSERDSDLD